MPTKAFIPFKGDCKVGSAGGTAKGSYRLTIPKEIVDHLGIRYGDHFSASVDDAGHIVFVRTLR